MYFFILIPAIILVAIPTHILILTDRSRQGITYLWISSIVATVVIVTCHRATVADSFHRQREAFQAIQAHLQAGEVDRVSQAIARAERPSDFWGELADRE